MEKIVYDYDLKYRDGNTLYQSRLGLNISKLLKFLSNKYDYDVPIIVNNNEFIVDFKIDDKYIEVIDSQDDLQKYLTIKKMKPNLNIIAIGSPRQVAKLSEIDSFILINEKDENIGSIFIEDPSLSFDYAHILPLVEKCSVLHGHTSTIMVELIGNMKDNLVIDFGDAKTIVKEALAVIDHKFFINKRYLIDKDNEHYYIKFDGPKGKFNLQLPKTTTYLLEGEATVENLSSEIIKILSPKMPTNIEAIGIYMYEGNNKGAHIISKIDKVN